MTLLSAAIIAIASPFAGRQRPPPLPPPLPASQSEREMRKGEKMVKREEADMAMLTYGSLVGPMLTQPPPRSKPESKPMKGWAFGLSVISVFEK
ncbi:P0434C04.19 [Oryza sativa (japonica cultivar-group)]